MVEKATPELLKKEQDQRDRMRWLAEQKTRLVDREKSQKIERDRVRPPLPPPPRAWRHPP